MPVPLRSKAMSAAFVPKVMAGLLSVLPKLQLEKKASAKGLKKGLKKTCRNPV